MRFGDKSFRRQLLFGQVVLIYQMPKTGSQTIEATLQQGSFPHPVLRFHYLSPAFARTLRPGLSASHAGPEWKQNVQYQLDMIHATARTLKWRRIVCFCWARLPKLHIITGMRESIGLMLASIFENYRYFAPDIESMTVDKCREVLLNPKTFKTIQDWFEREIKAFTGIDVFRTPFPFALGHETYENRFAKVLVYRFESIDKLPALLSEFLHCEIPALVNANLGDSKMYADRYRVARDQLTLPATFVTALYQTNMMKHFYSDAERTQFHTKWTSA